MHPYRHIPAPATKARSGWNVEELIVYGLLVLVGAIPVVTSLARHATFGAEATIGLLMLSAGAVGIIAHVRSARRGA